MLGFRFITGPPNVQDERNMGKIPRLYINTEFENEECFLIVYRALSASVCLLLNCKYFQTSMIFLLILFCYILHHNGKLVS